MTMQALVIAHAAFGHNHFFKNNHLFRQWTRADRVLDNLAYAKQFIADCEQKHGISAVENILDSAHALMSQGVSKYAPTIENTAGKSTPNPGKARKTSHSTKGVNKTHRLIRKAAFDAVVFIPP